MNQQWGPKGFAVWAWSTPAWTGSAPPCPRRASSLLRDTCATLLIEGGADLCEVMKYLGHRSIQVTERHYAQLVDERKRRTAAALDEIMRSAAGARVNVVRLR
jgi:integrase